MINYLHLYRHLALQNFHMWFLTLQNFGKAGTGGVFMDTITIVNGTV